MKECKQISALVVLVIGVYMIATNWGPVSPPLLSGVAFTLIGLMHSCKAKK